MELKLYFSNLVHIKSCKFSSGTLAWGKCSLISVIFLLSIILKAYSTNTLGKMLSGNFLRALRIIKVATENSYSLGFFWFALPNHLAKNVSIGIGAVVSHSPALQIWTNNSHVSCMLGTNYFVLFYVLLKLSLSLCAWKFWHCISQLSALLSNN